MKYLSILMVCIFLSACTNNPVIEESGIKESSIEKNAIKDPVVSSKIEKTTTDLDNIATENDPIKDIKQKFTAINAAKENGELTMDSIIYECPETPSDGIIYYYEKDGKVRLLKHSRTDGSHGGLTTEYYLWDNELFFEFIDESFWSFDAGNMSDDEMQPNTVDYYFEMRYYFNKGKLIKCLEKKFEYRTANKNNPKSNEVSNKAVECKRGDQLLADFQSLLDVQHKKVAEGDCIFSLKNE